MSNLNIVQFFSSDNRLKIYKVPVFTVRSYRELKENRGATYVLDLFMEVCRENRCHFLGLSSEVGYVNALLGFDRDRGDHEERCAAGAELERCYRACR